jgi:undecaprenyl-phosphate 4-deoxy-4-formamido-L-arabinose transferase
MTEEVQSVDVVIPVYNEEATLPTLFTRLEKELPQAQRPWKVILVDDGSRDESWKLLEEKANADDRFVAIRLARNFGQHAAVLAGLSASRADATVTMDADLQTPPSEMGKLISKLEEGYDVAGGWRQARHDTFRRKFFSRIMNRLVSRATGINLKDYGCMFRAYRRRVVEKMAESGGIASYVPSLAHNFTDRIAEVPVEHTDRFEGRSRYSFLKLVNLLIDLLTSSSMFPLRVLSGIGIVLASLGGLAAVTLLTLRIAFGPEWAAEGVFTLFAVLFFFVGAQFLAFGLLGEYIGRIYNEVRSRPRFVVRTTVGSAEGERAS